MPKAGKTLQALNEFPAPDVKSPARFFMGLSRLAHSCKLRIITRLFSPF